MSRKDRKGIPNGDINEGRLFDARDNELPWDKLQDLSASPSNLRCKDCSLYKKGRCDINGSPRSENDVCKISSQEFKIYYQSIERC